MLEAVLLQKVYGDASLKDVEELLKRRCSGLRIKLSARGFFGSDWVQIRLSGEDERVATRFLDKEVGLAPASADRVTRFSILRGVVAPQIDRTRAAADVGVFLPKPAQAILPLRLLQAQLADGRKFALSRIVETYGFTSNLPVKVRVLKVTSHEMTCEFAADQLETFGRWICSRLDRLIALGIPKAKLEIAVKKARLYRDVVGIESLGLLEHAMTCKLGTDAAGLISKFGRFLPAVKFSCFSPRRALKLLEGRWLCP